MKNKCYFQFLVLFLVIPLAHGTTLKEAFQSARLNMETLKRAEAVVDQRDEQKSRARAALLPNISGVGSYTKIDPPTAAGNSPFLLTRQYSAAIRLTQPLLRGGALSGFEFAKENLLLSKFQKDSSELTLYQLIITAYHNLYIAQVDVANLEEFHRYSKERVGEIRERAKIGRSRKGELVEAEAQFYNSDSQLQQGQISLREAEQVYTFYTNLKPEMIPTLGEIPKITSPLQEYLNKLHTRPDLMASRQFTTVAEKQIGISKGSHYPSVDLVGNYYIDRTGVLATSEWDVGVAVVVPLYQGGGVSAAVREAVATKRIAELNNAEAIRAAERDLAVSYQNLIQYIEHLKSLKAALTKAEEVYRLNKKDYKYGLVNNLDVLQSLSFFIQTKRSYSTSLALVHMNYKNLEALTGVLP